MSKRKKRKTLPDEQNLTTRIGSICDKVIEYGIYAIVFFVPLLPFFYLSEPIFLSAKAVTLQALTFTTLFIFLVKIMNTYKDKIVKTGLELPILSFVVAVFCSTVFSINFFTSLEGLFSTHEGLYIFLSYVLVIFLISNNVKKTQIDNIFFIMLITGGLMSIYGLFQYLTTQNLQRITSLFPDPNLFGGFLIMPILVGLSTLLFKKLRYTELMFIISLMIIYLVALFLTYSRAAFLSLIITSLFLIVYKFKEVFNKKIVIVCLTGTMLIFIFFFIFGNVSPKILLSRKEAIITRIEIWKSTLYMIREYPIIGSGLDTFGLLFPKYKSETYVISQGGNPMLPVGPHNLILQVSHSIGIVGLFTYLWLLVTFLMKIIPLLNRVNTLGDDKCRIISLLSALIGFLIVTQFSFHSISANLYFWILIGVGTLMWRDKNNQNIKKSDRKISKKAIYVTYFLLLMIYILGMTIIIKPLIADYFFKKALVYAENNQQEDTVLFLQKSIKLKPTQSLYHETLSKVYGNMIRDVKEVSKKKLFLDKALREINLAISLNPFNVSYYWTKGNIYHIYYEETFDKTSLNKAIETYKKVVELDPYDAAIHYQLAIIYHVEKGMLKEALTHLKYSIKLNPSKDIGRIGKEILEKGKQF